MERTKAVKRTIVTGAILSFLLLLLLFIGVIPSPGPVIAGIVGGLIWSLCYRRLMIWMSGYKARKLYSAGRNKGAIGWHRLHITDTGLREERDGSTYEVRFDGIERVAESDSHAYIFVSATSALIIPKRGVEQELSSILDQVRSRVPQHA